MTSTPTDPEDELHELLADLIVSANRLTRMAAKVTGNTTSPAIWRTLSVLESHGPMRLGLLASETRVSQPTATKLVQNLNELEWIKRIQDADDARAWQIGVTPTGIAALAAWRHELSTALAPLFSDLSADEHTNLDGAVRLLMKKVGLHETTRQEGNK